MSITWVRELPNEGLDLVMTDDTVEMSVDLFMKITDYSGGWPTDPSTNRVFVRSNGHGGSRLAKDKLQMLNEDWWFHVVCKRSILGRKIIFT